MGDHLYLEGESEAAMLFTLEEKLPIRLPDDPRVRHVAVRPHDLTGYDRIGREDR